MLWSSVPLVPRNQLAFWLVGLAIVWGVQFQPHSSPRVAPAPSKCPVASARVAPTGHCQRSEVEYVSFSGIGACVTDDADNTNRFTVVRALPGTPAEQAGLQPGDIVEQVDGCATDGMPLPQAISLIRGPEGTVVRLSIFRPSTDKRFDVSIRRALIQVPCARPASH